LRLRNILTSFDDFAGHELLSARDFQDYQSIYLNLFAEFRTQNEAEKESINDDVVFEIELIKQVEVNVDYILMLVQQVRDARGNGLDREVEAEENIRRAIDSSVSLRNKRDLILQFVDSISVSSEIGDDWRQFMERKRSEELGTLIADEGLNEAATRAFVDNAFRDGALPTSGTAITKILPPVSRFGAENRHAANKQRVTERLAEFFERFLGLV